MSAAAKARVRKPLSQETKDKIGAAHRGIVKKPLAQVLAAAAVSTKPYKNPRSRSATVRWARAVRERDGHACQDCGIKQGRLDAHHIKPWETHPELRFELSNGRTLCRRCHRKSERRQ